jgi:HlyD family secretion protein
VGFGNKENNDFPNFGKPNRNAMRLPRPKVSFVSAWRPLVIAGLAAAALGLSVIWAVDHPEPLMLQGEAEATRVDLAARVPGRVVKTPVDVGDRVAAGDLVIELDSPALRAGLDTSRAALAVARSNRDLAFSTRQEMIDARRAEREKAEADVLLAQKTYDRVSQLQERSFASPPRPISSWPSRATAPSRRRWRWRRWSRRPPPSPRSRPTSPSWR